jgi:N-acetylneuraminic acid mutarotase
MKQSHFMKKLLLLLFPFSFLLSPVFSQGTWSPRDTLPYDTNAMFQGIPGFSIGNYGYAGLGDTYYAGHPSDKLFQFDPSANSWTQKASFPGRARVAPACFVICDNAYVVTGSISNGGACVTECWEYDADNNTWTQKANFPGSARTYAVGFAIDSLGYVGTGANELADFRKDFYAYHPSTDTWTRIADFPGIARSCASGFAVNGKGYACFSFQFLNMN